MNQKLQIIQEAEVHKNIFDSVKQPVCVKSYFTPEHNLVQDYLKDEIDATVPVEYSLFSIYFPRPTVNDGHYFRKEMLVQDALNKITQQRPADPFHYISSLPIYEYLPSLTSAIFDIRSLTKRKIKNAAFFMGPDQSGTYFHYDTTDNVIGILVGTKRVYLFPPGAITQLKPYSISENCCKFCSIPPDKFGSFPILPKGIEPIVCDIHPGDLLYIPSGWWHHVVNVGLTGGISLILPTSFSARFSYSYIRVHLGYRNYKRIKYLFS